MNTADYPQQCLTDAMELEVAYCFVASKGWVSLPNMVMSMFIVTVPLEDEETGGTAAIPVAS